MRRTRPDLACLVFLWIVSWSAAETTAGDRITAGGTAADGIAERAASEQVAGGGTRAEGQSDRDGILVQLDVKVPMRDGVQLSAHLFLPAGEGSFPTILARTPYGKGGENNAGARRYARAGYAYVVQDTRGRFSSEGEFDPFMTEAQDGEGTIDWVRKQPWCNGKIGMAGGSYVGFVQWLAAARRPEGLRAICPLVTFADFHDDVAYIGGAFQLSLGLGWGAMVSAGGARISS